MRPWVFFFPQTISQRSIAIRIARTAPRVRVDLKTKQKKIKNKTKIIGRTQLFFNRENNIRGATMK